MRIRSACKEEAQTAETRKPIGTAAGAKAAEADGANETKGRLFSMVLDL
jgi:hypothetical protein